MRKIPLRFHHPPYLLSHTISICPPFPTLLLLHCHLTLFCSLLFFFLLGSPSSFSFFSRLPLHPTASSSVSSLAVSSPQIGGVRFLYDNLVESVERFSSSTGFGCILAHSMGLGKTLQVISCIDVLFRHTRAHTVLAIVPVSISGICSPIDVFFTRPFNASPHLLCYC